MNVSGSVPVNYRDRHKVVENPKDKIRNLESAGADVFIRNL
jgi:hypothetical protein